MKPYLTLSEWMRWMYSTYSGSSRKPVPTREWYMVVFALSHFAVHRLADLDFGVQRDTDLVLDDLDNACLLVEDTALEHVEHHPVLIETEGVSVHGAAADAGECCIEELGVDEFLCVFLEVSLTALDDLTAGKGTGSMPRKRYASR